ncbi:hypothetical protein PR048_025667 [Dryococelus australis]|uniref:Uncharacterized protein n=1 Tax=Dryococelus australis TaxID=614101 RepID=A0ABQ9GJ69_9NEOP|nr:hypothetical protein PR048_025667 [Dryococelus australis]
MWHSHSICSIYGPVLIPGMLFLAPSDVLRHVVDCEVSLAKVSSYKTEKALTEQLEEENDRGADGITNETFDYVDNSKLVMTVCCFPALLDGGKVPSKTTERKVFLYYSLYAWIVPIILIVISLMIDLIPTIPSSYIKPNFGLNKCWFNCK